MPTRHGARRFGLALLASAIVAAPAAAQRIPARTIPTPIDFATGEADNLFSIARSEENIHEWETALAELTAGEAKAAVDRLHRLLQNESGGVVPVAPGRFLGLRLAVVTTMANLPPAAAEAYEALVARESGNLGSRPLTDLDAEQLASLARRFPASSIGLRARLRLGDLAFTAGRGQEATEHYRTALDATALGSSDERRVAERLDCAAVLTRPATARAGASARRLSKGGSDVLSVLPAAADPSEYPAIGGADGRLPMAEPEGRPRTTFVQDVPAPGFDFTEGSRFVMFPVGDLDGIYVNTGSEVLALEPLRRGITWMSNTPLTDADRSEQVNKDMVLAPSIGADVVVAALQVPDNSVNVDFQASFRIISRIPQRRLFGFSRRTGKELWSHFDQIDGPRTKRFRGHDASGPPLVVGDTVYAPIHDRSGAIAFSIGAYDVNTGQPKWRQLVCSSQQDVNMFGNARAEFASSPLTVADGVVYGATNLGIVFALDCATGRTRWITSYEVIRMPSTRLQGQQERPVYFANNAPALVDGVACFTPLDSQYALGIDTETGLLLWRLIADAPINKVQNRVRWLTGALDDEFVLSGRGAIAVKARLDGVSTGPPIVRQLVRPDVLRSRGDDDFTPRPAVTADHVWFATAGRIFGVDRAGNPLDDAQQIDAPDYQPGNLLLVDGIVVSLRQHGLEVLMDGEALQKRITARLRESPDDPDALLRLANLRRAVFGDEVPAEGRAELVELYRRGIAASAVRGIAKNHPTLRALQRALFAETKDAAEAAVKRGDARALELLAVAREAAFEPRAFVQVQSLVLDLVANDPARRRRELDLLEREAPDATMPGNNLPVRAYVAWQRALLADLAPAARVAAWQAILEQHANVSFSAGAGAAVAEAAIKRLVAQHGADVYAEIGARAATSLGAAGDDDTALQEVSTRFPNSEAAKVAQVRLLDRAVRNGDLARACRVLAQNLVGDVPPRIARRVLVAATVRGNHALAATMIQRLTRHRDDVSDWPDDRGATYGAVIAALPPPPIAAASPALQVPSEELGRVPTRSSGKETMQLLPTVVATGFADAPDRPAFALIGSTMDREAEHLVAIDLGANGAKPVLFRREIEPLTEVLACGTVIVLPSFERVQALDHRTGEPVWELPNPSGLVFESLGVQNGVLHLFAQSSTPGSAELLGVEPLTGTILFRRVLPSDRALPMPKAVAGQLLQVELPPNAGVNIHRLDPLSGEAARTVAIAHETIVARMRAQADTIAARMFPRRLCADDERIYLPVDGADGEEPRLVAIGNDGKTVWQWAARAGNHLYVAQRDDRIVVVETDDRRPGRAVLLAARDGSTIGEEVRLGPDAVILNWEMTSSPNPAPAILALSDRMDLNRRQRRFVVFGVTEDVAAFEVPLTNEEAEVVRQPQFGAEFVTFGVRSAQRGAFRLYCVKLQDRSAVLPTGRNHTRIPVPGPHGLSRFGPYTVVSSADGLALFGEGKEK